MPILQNKRLGKMTSHEDLGMGPDGKRQYRCTETGDIRGYSKQKLDAIRDKRLAAKEHDVVDDVRSHGVSDSAVENLKNFLNQRDNGGGAASTPNVTETRAN